MIKPICIKCGTPMKKMNKEKGHGIFRYQCDCHDKNLRVCIG